ncbi:hypothetical protein R3P38DRAFT_2765565 [Favolaschia claudopus]|uniref:Uncharacterized protein n=1 Tax=Favolaschia claudopus TaxID=2862362 RepID=A0AAW0D6B0_9AGAR
MYTQSGSPTVDAQPHTDAEFNVAIESLKKKAAATVVVELNLDEIDGYRVTKKRSLSLISSPNTSPYSSPPLSPSPMPKKSLPPDSADENVELMYGTKCFSGFGLRPKSPGFLALRRRPYSYVADNSLVYNAAITSINPTRPPRSTLAVYASCKAHFFSRADTLKLVSSSGGE